MQQKFYHRNFEKQQQQTAIELKGQFVAVRMERSLFLTLKQEANEKGLDLSSLIRGKLK